MYRTLIDTLISIISNVEMPGTEEGRFSSLTVGLTQLQALGLW